MSQRNGLTIGDLADRTGLGQGVDLSREMLSVARANLDSAGLSHCQVRQADIMQLPFPAETFDLVTLHQILHFLPDPARAIEAAAQMIRPGGTVLIIDFAPHELEYMRSDFAHARLGFSHESVSGWMTANGLDVEKISDLSSDNSQDKTLTVSIWLGKDPRILMAGDNSASIA